MARAKRLSGNRDIVPIFPLRKFEVSANNWGNYNKVYKIWHTAP